MHRFIRFMHEYAPDVILVLTAIAIFVVAPRLVGELFNTADSQKATDLALKMFGAGIALVASIASYRRFFRGRVFAPRLRLKLTNIPVCVLSDGNILHSIDFEVENVGGVTIWNPDVRLDVLKLDIDEDATFNGTSTEGIAQPLQTGGVEGIEPGEIIVYHYRCRVPAEIEAFRISAQMTMDKRDAWHRSITVANHVEKKSPGSGDETNAK